MSARSPSEALIALAAKIVDERLSEAELTSLRQMLAEDPESAEWFYDWMELNLMLRTDFGDLDPVGTATKPLVPCSIRRSPTTADPHVKPVTKARSIGFATVCMSIAGSLLVAVSYLVGHSDGLHEAGRRAVTAHERAESEAALAEIATIAGGIDAEFRDGLQLGSRLSPGVLRLDRGVAQISFDQGAFFVLEGPAELELIDESTCRLLSGSMSADVLPEATAFQITAGGMQISERGAQFGIRTGPQLATEVHSFGRELELVDFRSGTGQSLRLASGQALRWKADERVVTGISPSPGSFMSWQELEHIQRERERTSFAHWLNWSQVWKDDPGIVLRYDFGRSDEGHEILSTVDPSRHVAKSREMSLRWVNGRWRHKQAMLFDGRTDLLEVPDSPELRLKGSLTLAVWLRAHRYPGCKWMRIVGKGFGADRNYGLWMSHNGQLYWQVCPERDPESQEVWDRHSLYTKVCPINEWIFVVGVVDEEEIRVYLNGVLQNFGSAPDVIATSDDPLTIGRFNNFPGHNDFFCGELDELILLKRALSAEEIRQMYEVGKPTFHSRIQDEQEEVFPLIETISTI